MSTTPTPSTPEALKLYDILREGHQPTTTHEYVFTAIGAAGVNAPYGPGITTAYRSDLAEVIGTWAVEGISRLTAADAATRDAELGQLVLAEARAVQVYDHITWTIAHKNLNRAIARRLAEPGEPEPYSSHSEGRGEFES